MKNKTIFIFMGVVLVFRHFPLIETGAPCLHPTAFEADAVVSL
jgi:hypothetical protein